MRLRKQSGFITPPELAESSRVNTLFVDGQSSAKESLEGTDALLHSDILGASANLMSKGHSKRLIGLLSSVHLVKSGDDAIVDVPAITILGDNPVSIKYGRPYIEYGASLSGVFTGKGIDVDVQASILPEADTLNGTAVKYSAGSTESYRGINWLSAGTPMTMNGSDVSITTAETFTDEGVTLTIGNEDLTVVVTSDVDDNVTGSYTVIYDAVTSIEVVVDSITRNVTVT